MEKSAFREVMTKIPRRVENRRVAVHLGLDVLLWGAIVALHFGLSAWIAALPIGALFAVFSFRSFGMMHEAVHSSSHSRQAFNFFLGSVYGVLCFLPFRGWREMHIEHHRWTGNVERDPTTKILLQFEEAQFHLPSLPVWAWKKWIPVLGFMQHVVFWRATISTREFGFLLASVFYLGALAYGLGPMTLGLCLITYLVLVEAINLPHHLGIVQERGDLRFHPAEQDRFARSCLYPKWFAHTVLLNFNLHSEHHLYPAYPWYQLDAIRTEVLKFAPSPEWCTGISWIRPRRREELEAVLLKSFKALPEERAEEAA